MKKSSLVLSFIALLSLCSCDKENHVPVTSFENKENMQEALKNMNSYKADIDGDITVVALLSKYDINLKGYTEYSNEIEHNRINYMIGENSEYQAEEQYVLKENGVVVSYTITHQTKTYERREGAEYLHDSLIDIADYYDQMVYDEETKAYVLSLEDTGLIDFNSEYIDQIDRQEIYIYFEDNLLKKMELDFEGTMSIPLGGSSNSSSNIPLSFQCLVEIEFNNINEEFTIDLPNFN